MAYTNTKPRRRSGTPQATRYPAGPWTGLRDSLDPLVSSDPQKLLAAENMYPLELDKASAYIGRPGFQQAGAQGGASGKRTGQLVYQFTKLDGTEITLRIVGGQGIQTFNWSTRAWTTVVSVANLTTASITLSETARCRAITFNNKVIITDGVNKPFSWDGTSGAGGLVSLTNASVWYGQPTVYYAKIFAIQNAARNTVEWSEEQDETIGYAQAAYNNIWELSQTDQEPLYAVVGTNDALYYFRERSIGAITGAVTPEFSSDGTKEGVSETIGTKCPGGIAYADKRIFFVDGRARPHVIVPGSGVVPLWRDVQQTLRGFTLAEIADTIATYDPTQNLVLFGMAELSQTIPSAHLVVNPVLNVPVAVWRGYTFEAMGVVKNADGTPILMHLSDDGYAYDHGTEYGDLWNDALAASTNAIRHTAETCHLGPDSRYEKRFDHVDALMRADADASSISVRVETPYGTGGSLTGTVTGSGDIWDDFDWDSGDWSADTVERRKQFGLNPGEATGRWARVRIGHEVAGEKFGIEAVTVEALPQGSYGEAP